MADEWTFTFDWRLAEHARVVALLLRERFRSGPLRVAKWIVVGMTLFCLAYTLLILALGAYTEAMRLAPLLTAVIVLLVLFAPIIGWIGALQLKSIDPNLRDPLTHTLSDTGLRVATRTANTELKWEGLVQVRETPAVFMFYYSKRLAYYLPKRALRGEEEVAALREWIRGRLSKEVPYLHDP